MERASHIEGDSSNFQVADIGQLEGLYAESAQGMRYEIELVDEDMQVVRLRCETLLDHDGKNPKGKHTWQLDAQKFLEDISHEDGQWRLLSHGGFCPGSWH